LNWKSIQCIWIQFKLHCRLFMPHFHIGKKLLCFISKTFEFFLVPLGYFPFLCFFRVFFVLVQITKINYMLHIVSYHHYILVKINVYQDYSNMSCHWHMNICYLIKLHVDVLRFVQKIVNHGANANVKGGNRKCFCI
jgi:hypothetical protein